eukprot:1165888-Rhodomonas_salina.3
MTRGVGEQGRRSTSQTSRSTPSAPRSTTSTPSAVCSPLARSLFCSLACVPALARSHSLSLARSLFRSRARSLALSLSRSLALSLSCSRSGVSSFSLLKREPWSVMVRAMHSVRRAGRSVRGRGSTGSGGLRLQWSRVRGFEGSRVDGKGSGQTQTRSHTRCA